MADTNLTPGSKSSEHLLFLLALVGALLAIAGGATLLGLGKGGADLPRMLIQGGMMLAGLVPAAYGTLRTILKYKDMIVRYEPEADAVAKLIPGQAGDTIRMIMGVMEKALAATPGAPPEVPVATPAAIAQAAATPSAAAGTPSAA